MRHCLIDCLMSPTQVVTQARHHHQVPVPTKQDIHHLMPNDSDLSCPSELDSPELEPSSVVVVYW